MNRKQNSKQFGIGKHKFFKSTKVIKNVVIHQVYSPSSSMSSYKKLEQLLMIQNKKNSKVHSKFSCHKTNSNYPFFYPNQSNLILSYSDNTILPILSYNDNTSFPLTRTPHPCFGFCLQDPINNKIQNCNAKKQLQNYLNYFE
jgi:hypothetical protein